MKKATRCIAVPGYVFDLPAEKMVESLNRRAARAEQKRKANVATALLSKVTLSMVALAITLSLTVNVVDAGDLAPAEANANLQATVATLPKWEITRSDRLAIAAAVNAVAGGEPYEAQVTVAAAIRLVCETENKTVEQALKAYRYPQEFDRISKSVYQAVDAVIDGNCGSMQATCMYNPRVESGAFQRTQTYAGTIGNLSFYAPNN